MQFAGLLQEHPKLGLLLFPFWIVRRGTGFYEIAERINEVNLKRYEMQLTPGQVKIVKEAEEYNDRNLARRFTNKKITPREFIAGLDQSYQETYIRPFIERQMAKCISMMASDGIPLFVRKSQHVVYESDLKHIESIPAGIIFNFIKLPGETHYFQTISHRGKVIILKGQGGMILTNDPCWLLLGGSVFCFQQKVDGKKLKVFFDKEYITIPKKLEEKYYSTFIRDCIRDFPVYAEGFGIDTDPVVTEPVLSYELDFSGLAALVLRFVYGDKMINPQDSKRVFVTFNISPEYGFRVVRRDADLEQKYLEILENAGLKRIHDNSYLVDHPDGQTVDKYKVLTWLNTHSDQLKKAGFRISQAMDELTYFTGQITIDIGYSDENDWFDIYANVKFGDEFEIPLIKLRKYLIQGIREYLLPDGRIAILPEYWFEKYIDLVTFGEKVKNGIRVRNVHLPLLAGAVDDPLSADFSAVIKRKRLSPKKKSTVPEGLKAQLRPYQTEGYQWLDGMRRRGFGVCLADDMGLGKTLQALSAIIARVNENNRSGFTENKIHTGQLDLFAGQDELIFTGKPSLVVMPSSLIFNWENEIRKFAPGLKYLKYTGMQRSEMVEKFQTVHLILTTYGIIRNDVDLLRQVSFDMIILDESQVIKSPSSKIAMAVIKLEATWRLALSGTPIENSLRDLWSQMNFLNKGLLGDLKFFSRYFLTPIEKNGDPERQKKLELLVQPFILRRTKAQVEKDLPVLSEEFIYCEMTPHQQQEYLLEKSRIRNSILQSIEQNGIERSAIVILQGLTKLRQMANHPGLTDENYHSDSGKFNEVLWHLENLAGENHKVLVFSSFVRHLELFSAYFDQHHIGYSMMTGQTRDRARIVDAFQNQESSRIFLISLKAGGVGLNLTKADYVFLLDPWWNPAAEIQALSRAHRIGQHKPVFVYRFITVGTIEEKIVNLQKKKSRLAELFIRTDNPLKELNVNSIKELID